MFRRYGKDDLYRVLAFYGLITFDVTTTKFKVVCPFHGDVNASMQVDLSDGTFYCYGCGATGNAWDFVSLANPELKDLDVCIALEKIVRSKEVKSLKVKAPRRKRKGLRLARKQAHNYYTCLKTVDWNHVETDEEKECLEYMRSRGFDKRALNIAGCKATYDSAYPVIFPILDNGDFRGYVCRTDNKRVEKYRKYLYNDGFDKRNTLCGTYNENKVVYLCEGYFDYLSLRARGRVKNVCAVLGWHLSDGQLNELRSKNITTVVSALDNDECGEKGTALLQKYFNVIRFPFPDGIKDPGEMSEKQIQKAIRKIRSEIKQHENKN